MANKKVVKKTAPVKETKKEQKMDMKKGAKC